jgi:hypothetical protein
MSEPQAREKRGIGDLFSRDEMKNFFIRYLVMTGCVELFIFFISFLSTFKPYSTRFPWREYFYAAFIVPIAITLLLGIIVIAFNAYYFHDPAHSDFLKKSSNGDSYVSMSKIKLFLSLSWQFQFLLFLLGLGLSAVLMFRMDVILALFAQAGGTALNWLLICLGVLVAGILVFGCLYLWFHYRLAKKRMEYVNQYKCEMMSRMGLLVLDDNTVIDRDGNVVYRPADAYGDSNRTEKIAADSLSLLPHIMNPRRKAE